MGRRRGGHGLEKIGVHNAVRVLLISGQEGFERSISDISVLSFSGNRARVPGCVYTITFLYYYLSSFSRAFRILFGASRAVNFSLAHVISYTKFLYLHLDLVLKHIIFPSKF